MTQVNFAKAAPPPPAASTAATTVNLDSEMEVSRCARILSFAVPSGIVVQHTAPPPPLHRYLAQALDAAITHAVAAAAEEEEENSKEIK